MRELRDSEEKILDRALFLIGQTGSTKITIRSIAKEAGVNVAAVNYYFGSKDEMMRRVDEFYLKNTIETYAALDCDDFNDSQKILNWADAVMEYSLRYPGITILLKEKANKTDEMSKRIMQITNEMNTKMFSILFRLIGGSEESFALNKIIFISSILQPLSDMHQALYPKEGFENSDFRKKYITHLLEKVSKT